MEISRKLFGIMAEPIGIYSLPLDFHHKNKKRLVEIASNISTIKSELVRSPNLIDHISNKRGQNLFDEFHGLNKLRDTMIEIAKSFLVEIGFVEQDCFIADAWLNIANAGATLQQHNHANSLISGTYYVNYDSKLHSQLTFLNARKVAMPTRPCLSIPESDKATDFNCKEIKIACNEGDLVFWESHLIHGYGPNPTPGRISLSFNIMPTTCSDGATYAFSAAPYKNT